MSIKSFSFLTLILLLVCTESFSTADDPHQDGNDLAKGLKAVSTGEELLDDVIMLAFRFEGRKTLINHFKRPKTVQTKGAAGTGTSKNSNDAAPRSDLEGNGCLNSDNQKINGRILLSYEDADVSGYVTYDADYDAPMHHPPKNN